jgi:hypothetical protein
VIATTLFPGWPTSAEEPGCVEVTRTVFYPAPVDWHFASLTLGGFLVVGAMVVWLWLKYRREGGRRY